MNIFTTMSDEKLKLFVEEYELLPIIRFAVISLEDYTRARFECFHRFRDDSIHRIDFFEKNPLATIEDYEEYRNN